MLTSVQSAGVSLEVNLRIAQVRKHTRDSKPRADVTRSPKQEYQWAHKKDLCSPIKKKKNHTKGKLGIFSDQ